MHDYNTISVYIQTKENVTLSNNDPTKQFKFKFPYNVIYFLLHLLYQLTLYDFKQLFDKPSLGPPCKPRNVARNTRIAEAYLTVKTCYYHPCMLRIHDKTNH